MENRHLIAKQVFELRVGFNQAQVPQLQESFSQHYWQSVVPAFEQLFDRLVAPDKLIRIDRLELDIGRWSAEDIVSGRFVDSLVTRLESAMTDTLTGVDKTVAVLPLRVGRFDLWLYFLAHGALPAGASQPESFKEWQQQVLVFLREDSSAPQRFYKLVTRQPAALERLLLQHDAAFLRQLLSILTNTKQDNADKLVDQLVAAIVTTLTGFQDQARTAARVMPTLLQDIAEALFDLMAHLPELPSESGQASLIKRRLTQLLLREASSPVTLVQWLLQSSSWESVFADFMSPDIIPALSKRIVSALRSSAGLREFINASVAESGGPTRQQVRQIELVVWRAMFEAALKHRRLADTDTLMLTVIQSEYFLAWRDVLMQSLVSKNYQAQGNEVWVFVTKAIGALPALSPERVEQGESVRSAIDTGALQPFISEDSGSSASEEDAVFYVQAAGVILFHPFLARFFQKLGLCAAGAFVDERSRQKAVCLVHYLATGEVNTPEYQLILPKLLCGMPLNVPVDHFIEIDAKERAEADSLMQAAIVHWDALGKSSPDWLREVFLLRDGKLEKRDNRWHLLIERKAQDLLLDRLPHGWGLGMVKLPWMDELLRVDW